MDDADQRVARGLLLRLVPLGSEAENARPRLPLVDLEDPDQVAAMARTLDAFVRARLVVFDGNDITLADQALADTWPRLRTWIEQERPVLTAAHQAIDAAHAWSRAARPDANLFRGAQLEAALRARTSDRGDLLGPTARQFLDASLERQRATRHWLRRRRMVLGGVLILLVGTITAISVARGNDSARNAAQRSQRLIAGARALSGDPSLAVQLAVAAYRASPSREAADLLYGMLDQPAGRVVDDVGSRILRVAVQAKGSLAAAVSENGSLRIWSLADPAVPALQATIQAVPVAVALAPQRGVLAGPCTKPGLCLWNLADPRHPVVSSRLPVPAHLPKGGTTSMAISADGTLLAAAATSGHTLVWSIAQPEHPRLLRDVVSPAKESSGGLAAVAFSPTGHLLATTIQPYGEAGEGHGATELWDTSDPEHLSSVATIDAGYQAMAFSPDGRLLAAAGNTKVGLWRLDRPAQPARIDGQPTCAQNPRGGVMSIQTIAFSPDGSQLAYSGEDSLKGNHNAALCLANTSPVSLASGSPVATSIPTAFGTSSAAYTPDGALFTGGHDGVARLWRSPLPQIGGLDTSDRTSWAVSPNGDLLIAPIASPGHPLLRPRPSSFGIWDISVWSRPVLDAVVRMPMRTAGFLDARSLLTVAKGGAVQLWNLADPHHPAPVASLGTAASVPLGAPFNRVVNSDTAGDRVAVLDSDGRLHLWRITRAPGAQELGSISVPGSASGPAGVSGDGRTAMFVSSTGITWWNIADPAHPVPGGTSPLRDANRGMGESAGSLMAATTGPERAGGGVTLTLFDLGKGRPKAAATLPTSIASELALTENARLLAATTRSDNALTLWDIGDPEHPRQRATLAVPNIHGIALAPTNSLMADWNDRTVQLWGIRQPAAPALRATLTLPSQATQADQRISHAEFTRSAKKLMVATNDSILLYDTDLSALMNRLCSFAGRPISRTQWQRYAPGVPYENPCPR